MKEQLEAVLDLARSAWRFRWTALAVAWVVALLGALVVLVMPSRYQSRAQIYLDTRSVLRPLLQGLAVSPQTQDQSDVVRHALLARPSLDQVATHVGLYGEHPTPESKERLLTALQEEITIKGDPSTGMYTILYADESAETARQVVKALLDTFVEKSLRAGQTDTQAAEGFLRQQVADYEKRLSESEQRLADFKKKNVGLMPDQRGDYFARLQTELANLQKVRTDLAVAERQRDELRRKISGQDNGAAILQQGTPSPQEIQSATALDARIRDSRHQLDELLLKYTEKHPEVIALKEQIKRLEEQRRVQLGGVMQTNGTRSEGSSVPVDPVVQNLQIALNSTDVQVAALQAQESESAARVAGLQRLVTTGPEIEAELARLNRDYGVTKAQYEALLQRLESARLSNDADRTEDRRFKVIEPPRAQLNPIAPNRLLLLIGVLFAAICMGLMVAALRALTHPVVFSKASLANLTGLPVIGTVSHARSPALVRAHRRTSFAYALVTLFLVVGILVTGVMSYPISNALRNAVGLGGT
jgi:polysaccharide chain length determinant protein (PEP-CTERM system associated)